MTDGTSQGIFVIVAVVIFGTFTLISYLIFQEQLKPKLASLFNASLVQAEDSLGIYWDEKALVPDLFLQKAIRDNLGLPENTAITEDVLKSLKTLTAIVKPNGEPLSSFIYYEDDMRIKSLKGLEHAVNLQE